MSLVYINLDTLGNLSKEIVEDVYSQIINKLQHMISVYEKSKYLEGSKSKWVEKEIKRYKSLLSYVRFLKHNQAYHGVVNKALVRRFIDGSKSLQLRSESDKARKKSD